MTDYRQQRILTPKADRIIVGSLFAFFAISLLWNYLFPEPPKAFVPAPPKPAPVVVINKPHVETPLQYYWRTRPDEPTYREKCYSNPTFIDCLLAQ